MALKVEADGQANLHAADFEPFARQKRWVIFRRRESSSLVRTSVAI
jgi:hypothetical protein